VGGAAAGLSGLDQRSHAEAQRRHGEQRADREQAGTAQGYAEQAGRKR